ncbi:hypothetical protein CAOG_010240 [Capsaspora owczarzaki ATCC 30864]|uniref:SANT domain-containing protein n=1 Tax=Capsaspora owczarzaki (strain ATCC 30864) TaxID=595528 RepID=A0A0D2X5U5_CAPO3|nr:hypothetical protein CAOG_010240 [Capsaspora owczarzaki ATCC 30864]
MLYRVHNTELKPELDSMTLHLSKAPALLWKPPPDTSEDTLESVEAALEQIVRETKLHIAHALAVLMYNDYDEAKALREASTLVVTKYAAWTAREQRKFESAVLQFRLNFKAYQELLPKRTIHEIIAHYYAWRAAERPPKLLKQLRKTPEEHRRKRECLL